MAKRTKFLNRLSQSTRYLEYEYWKKNKQFNGRYQMVFSMGDGAEALCFFNASSKSPRGKVEKDDYFYPPPYGEFSRWYNEVAKFPRPRSNGERCSGLKKLMKAQFWQASVTEWADDFDNRMFEIDIMTLRPCTGYSPKDGWEILESHMQQNRNLSGIESNYYGTTTELDNGYPF